MEDTGLTQGFHNVTIVLNFGSPYVIAINIFIRAIVRRTVEALVGHNMSVF